MRALGWARACGVSAVWLCMCTAAAAQPRHEQQVVVLAPNLDSERDQRNLVVAGLVSVGREVVDVRASADGAVLAACRTRACAGTVLAATGAALAVIARVDRAHSEALAVATVEVIAADGQTASAAVAVTEGMDAAAATGEAFERAQASLGLGDDALLRVSSTPLGALVSVDGKHVGIAPSHVRVKPGEYVVSAATEGFGETQQRVRAVRGRVVPVTLELPPLSPQETSRRSEQASSAEEPVLDTMLGGALMLAALPALVIPLDTLAREGSCDGHRDAMGRCSDTVYFGTQSALLLTAGALALGVGSYLLWAAPFRVDAAASSTGARLSVSASM